MTFFSRIISMIAALTCIAAMLGAAEGTAYAQEVSEDALTPTPVPAAPAPPEPQPEPAAPTPPVQGWSWRATPPPAPVDYVPPLPRVDDGKGLRIAGWVLFGVSYVASAYIGAMILVTRDERDSEDSEKAKAWYMFIPFGGTVAYGVARGQEVEETNEFGGEEASRVLGFVLTIPAIVQTTGMILASVGHGKKKRASRKRTRLALAPVGPVGTAGLSISGSF